ncbi:MAG: sigma-70 family RNA polymerase sigma factor [Atribacterota bacterium]
MKGLRRNREEKKKGKERKEKEKERRGEEEEGEEPSLERLALEMGVPVEEVIWLIEREKSSFLLSLEAEREAEGFFGEGQKGILNPEELLEKKELIAHLGKAIDELPEREKLVLTLYYFEGLTLKEIGRVLSIGESRVSQVLARTIAKLRVKLEGWGKKSYG